MNIPTKLRNKNAWVTTFSLLFFVLRTYFKIEIPHQEELFNLILLCGGAWGIWMVNPNEAKETNVTEKQEGGC